MSDSVIYHVGSTWKGFSGIRRLVIFGDSYSSVALGFPPPANIDGNERPNATQPLGIAFPGFTFNESGLPNWLGHLISKYCPEPRYNTDPESSQDEAWVKSPLLVHDYAKGGDTVQGVQRQVERQFLPVLGKKPNWAPWTANETLFITWVGINDCGLSLELSNAMENLFSVQENLFKAGARNFLFIDVPTVHRCPAGKYTRAFLEYIQAELEVSIIVPLNSERRPRVQAVCENWNKKLREEADKFCSKHKDVTVLLFSAFRAFDLLLDDPSKFGFNPKDLRRRGGSIWVDHLHPTSKVHDYIANCVADFLLEIPPSSST